MPDHLSKQSLLKILKKQGILNQDVLAALEKIPREHFVLPTDISRAYDNRALAIACQQTISQPYIVALMTQALLSEGKVSKVLEIGTGSGYQTAILSELVDDVYTIERIEQLQGQAKKALNELNCTHIHYQFGDGHAGWPEMAPFDGIIITAATKQIPPKLLEQLSPSGILVAPIGDDDGQSLVKCTFDGDEVNKTVIEEVRFVPLLPGTE